MLLIFTRDLTLSLTCGEKPLGRSSLRSSAADAGAGAIPASDGGGTVNRRDLSPLQMNLPFGCEGERVTLTRSYFWSPKSR
jgi:hypothetical protein